jgi:hypothetical protein
MELQTKDKDRRSPIAQEDVMNQRQSDEGDIANCTIEAYELGRARTAKRARQGAGIIADDDPKYRIPARLSEKHWATTKPEPKIAASPEIFRRPPRIRKN